MSPLLMRTFSKATLACIALSSALSMAQPTLTTEAERPFSVPNIDVQLESNKKSVLAFYDLMFNQSKPAEAMARYGGEAYRQHNPEVPDGKQAFIAYFEKMAKDYPGKLVVFKRVFAEGNFVTLHSEHKLPGWRGGNWAAMDIFRLDAQGKIVEHWDVLQKVPITSAHSNGMF